MFDPVDPKPDFPALERDRMRWWQDRGIVEQYLRRNEQSEKRWSFIDGPITANNPMGVHHAWGRTYKDAFQRFRTMQGYRQRYQNGFDCQGLWIEVEVERELGFTSKLDIEAYGVDRFVEKCKERVQRFAAQITEQSVRLGQWMDWDNSYFTNSDENNYAIWHFLKTCHEKGWLYKGNDCMPWCPRCATGLSNMEIVTEGYREMTHRSVYLKLPLIERPGESLLVWTTTPWTLAANVAAAVHPELTYSRVRPASPAGSQNDEILYLSKALVDPPDGRAGVLRGDYTVEGELPGRELAGLTYRGPFDELPAQGGIEHRVIEWDEVSEDEGTGIVHIAPGCGQEDFALSKQYDLPVVLPIDQFGNYEDGFGFLSGGFAGDVADPIFESLKEKGLLYHLQDYQHRYPICWRCDSELVFRVVDEWFINMDGTEESGKRLRGRIMEVTEKIQWIPEFGLARELDWLRNMSDWMISKKRYYGLALPIYPCSCGHVEVIGGREELRDKAIEGWDAFDGNSPHRPWVDAVKVRCPKCGEAISRITDVGNPWLDAGIVPYSTLRYDSDRSHWDEWFPADFITESFPGQFRNWFYSMLAMSAVLERREPFRAVLGHGLVRDEHGEEMHKSKGTAIWFDDAADRMGVDPMRWLFLRHNPATNVNFGWAAGDDVRRSLILTLWNSYAFFVTYANIDGWQPDASPSSTAPGGDGEGSKVESELDRWLTSELHQLIADVTAGLERYETMTPARRIESFVELLSNWYVRRSRRRFWKSEDDADKRSAYATLHHCLVTLAKLMAPFTPFVAEELYQNLVRSSDGSASLTTGTEAPPSVHLCDWPESDAALVDDALNTQMGLLMQITSLGLSARSKAGIKVRQPLPAATVVVPNELQEAMTAAWLTEEFKAELNVKRVELANDESDFLQYDIKPNLPVLGPKYGGDIGKIRNALADLEPAAVAAAVANGESIAAAGFHLSPDEVLVSTVEQEGIASAQEGGYVVVVDTDIPPELADEGLARELVHRIQNMRRDAGFEISDRITTYWQGDLSTSSGQALRRVIQRHAEYIKGETLSVALEESQPPADAHSEEQSVDGHDVVLGVEKQ